MCNSAVQQDADEAAPLAIGVDERALSVEQVVERLPYAHQMEVQERRPLPLPHVVPRALTAAHAAHCGLERVELLLLPRVSAASAAAKGRRVLGDDVELFPVARNAHQTESRDETHHVGGEFELWQLGVSKGRLGDQF